jgi:cbb3-type cytochrome oxidase cytochrome c subunit
MNHSPVVFLAAFFAITTSWFGLVLAPQIQIGRQVQETNTVNTTELYPQARPGLARQGLEVYRANGCAYCHSQQAGQTATLCDVILTEVGTNPVAVADALVRANVGASKPNAAGLGGLPKPVLQNADMNAANLAAAMLKAAGAKAAVSLVPAGPDITRGWGRRRTVAQDFLFDYPVMLGSQRVGPDLANIGLRQPDANWQLRHLYAPRIEAKDSCMPPYRFLFEKRKIGREPSPDALQFPKEFDPPPGFEIVPKPEARALAAYLSSLRADAPLFEAPMTVATARGTATTTNAPAK